jgi:hypothetical protein
MSSPETRRAPSSPRDAQLSVRRAEYLERTASGLPGGAQPPLQRSGFYTTAVDFNAVQAALAEAHAQEIALRGVLAGLSAAAVDGPLAAMTAAWAASTPPRSAPLSPYQGGSGQEARLPSLHTATPPGSPLRGGVLRSAAAASFLPPASPIRLGGGAAHPYLPAQRPLLVYPGSPAS